MISLSADFPATIGLAPLRAGLIASSRQVEPKAAFAGRWTVTFEAGVGQDRPDVAVEGDLLLSPNSGGQERKSEDGGCGAKLAGWKHGNNPVGE